MLLTARKRVAKAPREGPGERVPSLASFVDRADYSGALALLEFKKRAKEDIEDLHVWIGFCALHLGRHQTALRAFETARQVEPRRVDVWLYIAICHFFMQEYDEAFSAAMKGPSGGLKNRILFHIAFRKDDEKTLLQRHSDLTDTKEDQLSLAAVHFQRRHFQEAVDVYKRLYLEHREDLALNVYIATCYYKMDYYDVSLQILDIYLQNHPASPTCVNLKACNEFKLYNGKAAEATLKTLVDTGFNVQQHPLLYHNLVVFQDGEAAMQVLPDLVDVIPEARLNLVIYHLKNDDIKDAFELMKHVQPQAPEEFILKAIVHTVVGQATNSREHLKLAQQHFQMVGSSAGECDTIPGRQCMASRFFLLKQFDEVDVYLKSIRAYMTNDDTFHWNNGISMAASEKWKEAEESLLLIQSDKLRSEHTFASWLARCHIMNGKPQLAWELYLKQGSNATAYNLLQQIANDFYLQGQFYFAAKAFKVLERMDPEPEHADGLRGACVGVFHQVVAGLESKQALQDTVKLLRQVSNPQTEYIVRVIAKWCSANDVPLHV